MSNYLPSRDADLDIWALNFQTLIAAAPITYGLVAADATAITNAFNSWHAAFLAATNPATRPVLSIARMTQGTQEIRATDEATPNKRAKPAGSAGLLVYRAIGTAPINDPEAATFMAFVGKPDIESSFTHADNGKVATYFARWTNSKGEVGPWSQGVSGSIAA